MLSSCEAQRLDWLAVKLIGKLFSSAILLVILLFEGQLAIAQPVPLHSNNPSAPLFDDTIIVKYKETSFHSGNPIQRKAKMDDIGASLLAQQGVTAIRTLPILGVHQFRLGPGQSLNNVILALRNHPEIQYAEYNFRVIATENVPPPNDSSWLDGSLWGLTKIRMDNAWAYRTDASNIVVAVIDSGIDYEHHDLAPNMWMDQQTESHGINTCVSVANPRARNPMDQNGHGTMVAGVIGAKGDNSFGGVGVDWDVKLLAARFLCEGVPGETPNGSIADAQDAIEYAMDKHADIINNSWRVLPPVNEGDIQILLDAVRKTNCEGENLPPGCKPALFVAAAGNGISGESLNSDSSDGKVYPANFPVNNIIVVAATDWDDHLWPSSHYGVNSVAITAPGVSIESTYLHAVGNGYSALDGTSMAAPHVAGCAALLQAQSVASGSPRSVESLKNKLLDSADRIDGLSGYISSGRRLNCGRALTIVRPPNNYRCLVSIVCESDEIGVKFKADADPGKIKKMNELLGVEVLKTSADGQMIIKVPSGTSVDRIRRAYLASPEVESVTE